MSLLRSYGAQYRYLPNEPLDLDETPPHHRQKEEGSHCNKPSALRNLVLSSNQVLRFSAD